MTQEEIIQIPVSAELAQRLRPYQSELPPLPLSPPLGGMKGGGLHHVEGETEAKTRAGSAPEEMALQKRVIAALRLAGAVGPDPEEVARYLAQRENQRWTPIQADGKPASEMIVEERDSRSWARW